MSETTPPIVVNENPTGDNVAAAIRQIAIAVGAWAVGRGYLEADTATAIGTVLLVAIPFFYGQWKTYVRSRQLATVAAHVSDAVAVTK